MSKPEKKKMGPPSKKVAERVITPATRHTDSIPHLPSVSNLDAAIDLLNNNKRISTVESKDGVSVSHVFDTAALRLARGLLRPDQVYSFLLNRTSTITTGSAVLQVNIATDLTVFAEGATMAALFDEVKLNIAQLRWVIVAGGTTFGYLVGYTPVVYTTTPTAVIVERMPYSTLETTNWPSSGTNGPHGGRLTAKPKNRTWGACTDEGVSAPRIVSGLNGTFSFCHVTTPPSTTLVFAYYLQTRASFRNRG